MKNIFGILFVLDSVAISSPRKLLPGQVDWVKSLIFSKKPYRRY